MAYYQYGDYRVLERLPDGRIVRREWTVRDASFARNESYPASISRIRQDLRKTLEAGSFHKC